MCLRLDADKFTRELVQT